MKRAALRHDTVSADVMKIDNRTIPCMRWLEAVRIVLASYQRPSSPIWLLASFELVRLDCRSPMQAREPIRRADRTSARLILLAQA